MEKQRVLILALEQLLAQKTTVEAEIDELPCWTKRKSKEKQGGIQKKTENGGRKAGASAQDEGILGREESG